MFDSLKNKIGLKLKEARDQAFALPNGQVAGLGKLLGAQPVHAAAKPVQLPQQKPITIPLPQQIKERKIAQAMPKQSKYLINPSLAPNIISPLAEHKQSQRVTPMATPTVTPTPAPAWSGHNIQIPASQGKGMTTVPQYAAQALMNAFDDIGEATNAATVLHHPKSQNRTKQEIVRMGEDWNYGENASFKPVADAIQSNGSVDRGLMRINSDTFNGLMARHPDWMAKIGVDNWDQMADPVLNAQVGRLVLLDSNYDGGKVKKNPSYKRWYAAPLPLRVR